MVISIKGGSISSTTPTDDRAYLPDEKPQSATPSVPIPPIDKKYLTSSAKASAAVSNIKRSSAGDVVGWVFFIALLGGAGFLAYKTFVK